MFGSAFLTSLAVVLYIFPTTPLTTETKEVEYPLMPGSSVKVILRDLVSQQVLTPFQSFLFNLYIRSRGLTNRIQAGEYHFSKNITPQALLAQWVAGEVVRYAITLPEGITVKAAIEIIEGHPKIKKTQTIAFDPSEEGCYYPDTYYFTEGLSARAILQQAKALMTQRLATAWEARDKAVDAVLKSPYEALIVASIIEKETSNEAEKPIISGIFQRRLLKNMRLQADPAVIYGMGLSFDGNVTKEDLKRLTPYNTYIHVGLPPTPIALPGKGSIEAALHPDNSDFLYFVAKGDGTHHFSVSLEEHNEAVKRYQRKQ